MADLPRPVNTPDLYLAAMHNLIAEQNAILGDIRDQLGQANDETPPAEGGGPRPVELREPAPASPPDQKLAPEPATDPGPRPQAGPDPAKTTTRAARTGRRTKAGK